MAPIGAHRSGLVRFGAEATGARGRVVSFWAPARLRPWWIGGMLRRLSFGGKIFEASDRLG